MMTLNMISYFPQIINISSSLNKYTRLVKYPELENCRISFFFEIVIINFLEKKKMTVIIFLLKVKISSLFTPNTAISNIFLIIYVLLYIYLK